MDKQNKKKALKPKAGKQLVRFIIAVVIVAGIAIIGFKQFNSDSAGGGNKELGTFEVQRGDLTISVTESGNIKALNTYDIKSEVEGRTTIISIVDEGTYISEEDVNNGKILVELDSSQIKDKLTRQEIKFLTSEDSYIEATESLDSQKKQNESDITAGEMASKFALMDLHKYLGEVVAKILLSSFSATDQRGLEIATLIEEPNLGGEALQELRKLEGDIKLKKQKLELAISTYDWTVKLFEKEYVSFNQKEADRLDKETKEINLNQAVTAKDLFIRYEFPKKAEKLYSDHTESLRNLDRINAKARSKLAQAEARLKSQEKTYSVQKTKLDKLRKQFVACIIKAPATGQVVYSSSMMDGWMRRNRPIEIGAEIRERQKIISIPDATEMKAEIKVHETWIDRVKLGQSTKITIAAFLDKAFTGKILKKAPLANPENWMNPDLKVYTTDVSIDGTHDFLKTGMTAKVEVIIEELKDILSVPIQAVTNLEGDKFCYVVTDKGTESRAVETGGFNDNFVEIKSGLDEGETVLLNPPRFAEIESKNKRH